MTLDRARDDAPALRRRPRRRRGPAVLGLVGAATLVVVGTLSACSPKPPGPQEALETLTQAIESGDFGAVEFVAGSGDAAAAAELRTTTFEGIQPWVPQVAVGEVTEPEDDPDAATASLAYTWDVDDGPVDWTYTTQVSLARDAEDAEVWRVAWTPGVLVPDLQPTETLRVTRQQAERGRVLGAGDQVIVEPRAVRRVGVDKTLVDAAGQEAAARALAAALTMDVDAYVQRVASAGPKAFVEAIVVRDGDTQYDVDALLATPGVRAVADTIPLAPTRRFARPILGTVGSATAEIVEKSQGAIAAGDLTGLSGLQRQYDAQLRGRPGLTIEAVPADGVAVRQLFRSDPAPGTDLRTTLDPRLQDGAETILADVGPASAIVAIRPSSGEVLAAASGPGGDGMSTATLGQYAPGSTFKVASALALLRSGLTADSTVSCPPTTTVDGRQFSNFPDYPSDALGDVPLRTAFAQSCNTAFISARDQAPQSALVDAAGSLGLVPDADLGFAAFLGAVPSDSDGTDHAASMIGQGRVLASPLGMATVAASVAAGATVTPHLVVDAEGDGDAADEAADDPSGAPTPAEDTPTARPHVPLTGPESESLRALMRAVVTEGGGSFLQDAPGGEVMAKSGTAQFGDAANLQNHVWMIAIQGDLAVAVFVDVGDYGSTTAGPLLEQFLATAAG
ncbi:penicillin-binding transpeptidase domain-containing protein [Cellulomonas fimi]|uniref:penicillin-binding transpeptidase domain-containing protein n=1 Tax=Cellulomonas fimi TaxID=1708 RepID=UPI00234CA826|nr:penicillin-binding transpeptidase domain-containing protein [Cellulomonas fimi]MDC7122599.1 penicillin-binding transpeptidase domain-containing protein [Cellulomonas fimi]